MTIAASILGQAGQALGDFLPRLGGAVVLLLIGILLARLVSRLLIKILQRVKLDAFAERAGVSDVLQRAGLGRSLSSVVGGAIRIALTLIVIFAALSLLGLQFLSQSLNAAILVLPKLLIAAALILAGVVLGGFARDYTERLAGQMDFPVALGRVVQITVFAIFAIIAAAELSIDTTILLTVIAILLAGIAATLALAFGLGGREIARALSAGRYVRHDYTIGQEISFDEVRGRITAIETTSTLLDTSDGRVIRVPNHVLIQTVVTIHTTTGDGTP
jgi:small-conductance mechanosensitive channel